MAARADGKRRPLPDGRKLRTEVKLGWLHKLFGTIALFTSLAAVMTVSIAVLDWLRYLTDKWVIAVAFLRYAGIGLHPLVANAVDLREYPALAHEARAVFDDRTMPCLHAVFWPP
ncbi:hypothetical protein QO004_001369 [Rhizobium mesoamericanum]|nr:hypothetical protein [Rhizobium mesoamericanum]